MSELKESLLRCKVEGNVLFLPPISEGVMANYKEVRAALLNAGATYKRNTFVFPNDAQPYIDRLCGGEKVNIKKEFQFFATPDGLANRLVKLSGIKKNDVVLEPSAGQGAIVKAIHRAIPGKRVQWCEIMDINQNVMFQIQDKQTFVQPDFLGIRLKGFFDKVIANPPFSKNQDIDHIRKMYEVCKEGGRIVTIASNHWKHSGNKKEVAFKKWLDDIGASHEEIEAGAFKESGTSIAACIIIINK